MVMEGYTRYGPTAAEIEALPSPGALPERYTEKTWVEFSSPAEATRMRTVLLDAEGNVVQYRQSSPEGVAAGRTIPVNVPHDRAERLHAMLESGDARVVSQSGDSLTLEFSFPSRSCFRRDAATRRSRCRTSPICSRSGR